MARINSNIPSVIAQQRLARTGGDLTTRLERLSTGLRINRGKDDPAGLIISERLRSDIEGVNQGVKNAERAGAVIATTEASLAEVNDLLNTIRALMVEGANTGANSPAERKANQAQIDSAIDSITRISNTSSFGGLKLLNGSLDYTVSGIASSAISKARVLNASFVGADTLEVEVDVVASAQKAQLFFNGDYGNPATDGTFLSTMTLEIRGTAGVEILTFASGMSLTDVAESINKQTSFTGVVARLVNASDPTSGLVFESLEYGSDSFVSVRRINEPPDLADSSWGTYQLANNAAYPDTSSGFPWTTLLGNGTLAAANRDGGQDVSALVNGNLATGEGLKVKVNSTSLGLELLLTEDFATMPSATNSTFLITGGGALFQLGPDVSPLQQATIGIGSVAATDLGGVLDDGMLNFLASLKTGQGYSIEENVDAGDFTVAQKILAAAIDDVTILRGRLGAFERNVLQTNVRSLQSAFENLSASQSVIRDADFAYETSMLTRTQILQQAGISSLALANQSSQAVLQLLG